MISQLKKDLSEKASAAKAKNLQRFFKTGKGQYAEGDIFLGVTVPDCRSIAKKYSDISFFDIEKLLDSKLHEERLVALLILVQNYKKSDNYVKENIFNFYLNNLKAVNNWDLVDLSSHQIVGNHLLDKDKFLLYSFANSADLWQKRIAIVSTYAFIKNNDFEHTLNISKILLSSKEDLIHKAIGWMLREIGKRDQLILEKFLQNFYLQLPRTTLRYAIEKFPEVKRKKYLTGTF